MKQEKTAMETLLTRRSVRAFTPEPVGGEEVRAILRAGMYAPSAHNQRTWEIITITSRRTLDMLAPMSKWWKMLYEAPLCIACCGRAPAGHPEFEDFLVQNSVAATENMLLAIDALGLGGVWLGIRENAGYYGRIKEILELPSDVRLVSLIAAGHIREPLPARAQPQERFEEQKWHKEVW